MTVSDRAQASKALRGKAGRPPEAEGNVGNANIKASDNNADYLTARIARDCPDILERMKGGEYASVRQAATLRLAERGDALRATVNVLASLILAFGAALLGVAAGRALDRP